MGLPLLAFYASNSIISTQQSASLAHSNIIWIDRNLVPTQSWTYLTVKDEMKTGNFANGFRYRNIVVTRLCLFKNTGQQSYALRVKISTQIPNKYHAQEIRLFMTSAILINVFKLILLIVYRLFYVYFIQLRHFRHKTNKRGSLVQNVKWHSSPIFLEPKIC